MISRKKADSVWARRKSKRHFRAEEQARAARNEKKRLRYFVWRNAPAGFEEAY
jgi:hypothetical protein